jgi:hypothetical protein
MSNPQLNIQQIVDVYLRQNFSNLADYFNAQNQLLNFGFKEVVFTGAQANFLVAHGLKVVPQDIIVTKIVGPGKVTFNHGLFDSVNMNLTASDACRIRFFFGTYYNFTSTVQDKTTDGTTYSSGA